MNAAIYCRVSKASQEEDGTSLESQEERCRRYAGERGHTVAERHVYRETHTGAELWERPRLSALRKAVRQGEVTAVIAYAVDRLSRKQAHLAIVADECDRAGVALLFVTEEFEKTAIGEFIRSAKGFAAEVEREKIRERTQRGLETRVRSGKPMGGGRPLYGYRWRDEERSGYEIDERTAPIVRRIFAQAAAGSSLRSIAMALVAEGVPTATGKPLWKHTTIQTIITHPGYTGEAVAFRYTTRKLPGGRTHVLRNPEGQIPLPVGTIPPLVDAATFAVVQGRMARNKAEATRNNRNPEAFLLRAGFVRCGYCGLAVSACWQRCSGKAKRDLVRPVYRIARGSESHPCRANLSMCAEELDRKIWRGVKRRLTTPEVIEEDLARMRANDTTGPNLAAIDKTLAELARRQGNLARRLALFDDDEAAAPLVAEIAAIGKQKRQLEEEREGLVAQRATWLATQEHLAGVAEWCRTAAANLDDMTYEQRRDTLKMMGVQVRLYRADREPRYEVDYGVPTYDDEGDNADCVHNAQEFLRNEGVSFARRDYFKERFTPDELRVLLNSLHLRPADVLSRRSRAYGDLIGDRGVPDDELLALMAQEPTLLRRPLVVRGDRAVIGFDREALAALAADRAE